MKTMTSGKITPEVLKQMDLLRAERREKIESILLPHQVTRLKSIALQMDLKNGVERALGSSSSMELLGIDDKQLAKLKQRSSVVKAQLKLDIEKLKEDARKEILKELTFLIATWWLIELVVCPWNANPNSIQLSFCER